MPYYLVVIIASFVISCICIVLKENREVPIVFFPFFLLLTALVEYFGEKWARKGIDTTLLYGFFSSFEFVFYLIFFRYLLPSKNMKKIILIVLILYVIGTVTNILFFQGKSGGFPTYTYMLGCLLVIIFSIVYFTFLFRFPETGSLTKNPYFWIVTGLMFFETCTFTFYGLNNFITQTMRKYDWLLQFTSDVLNILLYTSFTIGFLCRINIRKLLASS